MTMADYYDHRDPTTKKAKVSGFPGGGYTQSMLDEIAKCDLVCSNCHKIRSERLRQLGFLKRGKDRKPRINSRELRTEP